MRLPCPLVEVRSHLRLKRLQCPEGRGLHVLPLLEMGEAAKNPPAVSGWGRGLNGRSAPPHYQAYGHPAQRGGRLPVLPCFHSPPAPPARLLSGRSRKHPLRIRATL